MYVCVGVLGGVKERFKLVPNHGSIPPFNAPTPPGFPSIAAAFVAGACCTAGYFIVSRSDWQCSDRPRLTSSNSYPRLTGIHRRFRRKCISLSPVAFCHIAATCSLTGAGIIRALKDGEPFPFPRHLLLLLLLFVVDSAHRTCFTIWPEQKRARGWLKKKKRRRKNEVRFSRSRDYTGFAQTADVLLFCNCCLPSPPPCLSPHTLSFFSLKACCSTFFLFFLYSFLVYCPRADLLGLCHTGRMKK